MRFPPYSAGEHKGDYNSRLAAIAMRDSIRDAAGLPQLLRSLAMALLSGRPTNVCFRPIADISALDQNTGVFVRMLFLAVAAAIGAFSIRYGVPHLLGTDTDITIFDATVRALVVLIGLVGLGWWWSRRERI